MPLTVHVPFHIREETTVMTILCVNKPEYKRGREGGGGGGGGVERGGERGSRSSRNSDQQ